jgi:hypothetical protein
MVKMASNLHRSPSWTTRVSSPLRRGATTFTMNWRRLTGSGTSDDQNPLSTRHPISHAASRACRSFTNEFRGESQAPECFKKVSLRPLTRGEA